MASSVDGRDSQHLSKNDFDALLKSEAKYKLRSHETHHTFHVLELQKIPSDTPINTVLIGDSMLERLKTTGTATQVARLPSTFNAGVGGDKIENVLYRLDQGLTTLLETRSVKVWVLVVGTNDLVKALKPAKIAKYRLLVQALLRIAPGSRVLSCAIFRRKDVGDDLVDASNGSLRGVVESLNAELGEDRLFWLDAPEDVTKERLVDNVHLDEEGYALWDRVMHARVLELRNMSSTELYS
jgi:lysophospholipase L1-like esterase